MRCDLNVQTSLLTTVWTVHSLCPFA